MTAPQPDCQLCPRLAAFRSEQRNLHADWFNAPVPAFGDSQAQLMVAGLAPGLRGANRTGRPFTGDYAGDLLYEMLQRYGFTVGTYDARPDDGLKLRNCIIVNAVRCVPPQNKPTPQEIRQCNHFLASEISALPRLKCILALGRIAHEAVLTSQGLVRSRHVFAHNACHELPGRLSLIDSYHCSRYNTNTGRLTPEMFRQIFDRISGVLGG